MAPIPNAIKESMRMRLSLVKSARRSSTSSTFSLIPPPFDLLRPKTTYGPTRLRYRHPRRMTCFLGVQQDIFTNDEESTCDILKISCSEDTRPRLGDPRVDKSGHAPR